MKLSKPTVLLTAGVVLSASALAVEPETGISHADVPSFEDLDKNHDQGITVSESAGTWLAKAFATADANRDGKVDKAEYEKASS